MAADRAPHDRVFTLVVGVLREALRVSRCEGFALPDKGPENLLLLGWLGDAGLPCEMPSVAHYEAARALFEGSRARAAPAPSAHGPNGSSKEPGPTHPSDCLTATDPVERVVTGLAGLALASARGLLLIEGTNKTCLLLGSSRPVAPILPLGDLYASEVLDLCAECTVPPFLRQEPVAITRAVDAALRDYFEEGFQQSEAFGGLAGRVLEEVRLGLEAARGRSHLLPLVPKLREATLGIDLDL